MIRFELLFKYFAIYKKRFVIDPLIGVLIQGKLIHRVAQHRFVQIDKIENVFTHVLQNGRNGTEIILHPHHIAQVAIGNIHSCMLVFGKIIGSFSPDYPGRQRHGKIQPKGGSAIKSRPVADLRSA